MQNKPKLQVGDIIYCSDYGRVCYADTIVRITPTQAISVRGCRFKLDLPTNGILQQIGGGKWNSKIFELENENLKNELIRIQITYKLSSLNFEKLDLNVLKKINQIIQNEKTS
jgi:hypothetical protein